MNTFSVLCGKKTLVMWKMQVIANYADLHSPYLVPTYKNTTKHTIFLNIIIIAQNRSVRPC